MAFPEPVTPGTPRRLLRTGAVATVTGSTLQGDLLDLWRGWLVPAGTGVGVRFVQPYPTLWTPLLGRAAASASRVEPWAVKVSVLTPGSPEVVLWARMGEVVPVCGAEVRVSLVASRAPVSYMGELDAVSYSCPVQAFVVDGVDPGRSWVATTSNRGLVSGWSSQVVLAPPRAVAFRFPLLGDLATEGGAWTAERTWPGAPAGSGLWSLATSGYWVPVSPSERWDFGEAGSGTSAVLDAMQRVTLSLAPGAPPVYPGGALACPYTVEWLCQ